MRRTSFPLAFLAGALLGCTADEGVVAGVDLPGVVGSYRLGNINGQGLPFRLPRDPSLAGWVTSIASGTLTVNDDHTFTDVQSLSVVQFNGAVPFLRASSRSGTWIGLEGSKIALSFASDSGIAVDTADVAGPLIARTDAGLSYLYSR